MLVGKDDCECDGYHEDHVGPLILMLGTGAVLWWLLACEPSSGKRIKPGNAPAPVEVWILDDDGIEVDGARLDLMTTVARARAIGAADIYATANARRPWIEKVSGALLTAGVNVRLMTST